MGQSGDLLYADEVFRIQGAIFEVSREMGSGYLEAVYQECLAIEFRLRGIPFVASPALSLTYKEELLAQRYIPDFTCFGEIIVELKAVRELAPEHRAQVLKNTNAILPTWFRFEGRAKGASSELEEPRYPENVRVFRVFRGSKSF